MSEVPPDAQAVFATLELFLEAPDGESAREFADAHPELRDPEMVGHLIARCVRAMDGQEHDRARDLLAHIDVLCGPLWPDGPAIVAEVLIGWNAAKTSLSDAAVRVEAVRAARRVLDADAVRVVPPALAVRLLDMVALIFTQAYADTSNRELLDQAIVAQRRAVDRTSAASADFPSQLNNLAAALTGSYELTGERGLLDEAVATQRRAVAATTATDARLGDRLDNLATYLTDLYELTGERGLLDEAVATHRLVVAATTATDARLADRLDNLASRLSYVSRVMGERGLLDEAVTTQRRAIRATPATSTELPSRVCNLATHLADLYELTGERGLLDEAVATQRQAVDLTPATSPQMAGYLNNLALWLAELYELTAERSVLDEAVASQRQAVDVTPITSHRVAGHFNNLAKMLAQLYRATGERTLLDEAVATQRQAVDATPATSTDPGGLLNNLAQLLAELYEVTGERTLLDEAVATQRQAVDATAATNTDLAGRLHNLALFLAKVYEATGDGAPADEAVTTQRQAVAATPATSTQLGSRLNNLAMHLDRLHGVTGERSLLDQAVATQRQAVAATPATSTQLSGRLHNLAGHLVAVYGVTGERSLLDEAVATQRQAVAATPATSTQLAGNLDSLAHKLLVLYGATGDQALLDEAWQLVDGVAGGGPWETAMLCVTRASLARKDVRRRDRYRVATEELTLALNAFRTEIRRLEQDPLRRRDLGHRVDGLLGNLAVNQMLAGDVDQAVALLEDDRVWLAAPRQRASVPAERQVPIAWVAASEWETAIVTTVDERTFTLHVVERTRGEILDAVLAALKAARPPEVDSVEARRLASDAQQRTVLALCELTSDIVAEFPRAAGRLLVVPLGICALLPYSAARHDGEHLIDHTAVTLAPSLSWARAVSRARRGGPSLGVFHPGKRVRTSLDLTEDRQVFEDFVRGRVLDRPTAQQLVANLVPGMDILHISSHGAYNSVAPLESWLDLETDLTIQAVLNHANAPWFVNLSACETAIPDLQASEQLISFPTGFLLAGAAHVLATLWPVDNRHATAVNRDTYEQLAAGAHPSDALRHAVQRLRGIPSLASSDMSRTATAAHQQPKELDLHEHPLSWAPFTHYGSPW